MTPRFAAAALLLLPAALAAASTACRAPRRSAAIPAATAAAPVPPDTGGATFDLSGVVRDEDSGRPLPHTLVVVAGGAGAERRTGTDSAGAYHFAGLPRGGYAVSARRVGYYVERRDLSVRCPVTVVDAAGRPLSRAGPCDPARQTLNFLMRAHALY